MSDFSAVISVKLDEIEEYVDFMETELEAAQESVEYLQSEVDYLRGLIQELTGVDPEGYERLSVGAALELKAKVQS